MGKIRVETLALLACSFVGAVMVYNEVDRRYRHKRSDSVFKRRTTLIDETEYVVSDDEQLKVEEQLPAPVVEQEEEDDDLVKKPASNSTAPPEEELYKEQVLEAIKNSPWSHILDRQTSNNSTNTTTCLPEETSTNDDLNLFYEFLTAYDETPAQVEEPIKQQSQRKRDNNSIEA
jgi:hypothetical protein